MNALITPNWNSEFIDKHRRGISDVAWEREQPMETNYFIGDIVEFKEGGIGVIYIVQEHGEGHPASYSVKEIKGKPFHPKTKVAWHYEGDFKRLIGESPLRSLNT